MARSAATDPLEKFRFRVEFSAGDGESDLTEASTITVGFHDIQLPKRTTTKGTYREGNDIDVAQLYPGLSSMEDIVMSRGLVPSTTTAAGSVGSKGLYQWMSSVHTPSSGHGSNADVRDGDSASNQFRKEVTIIMLDREGQAARAWKCYQAFPVNFVPGSDVNAEEDGEKSLEQLTIAYEDFQEVSTADLNAAEG